MPVKTLKLFQCEVCKKKYADEEEAKACDALHASLAPVMTAFAQAQSLPEVVYAFAELLSVGSDVRALKVLDFSLEEDYWRDTYLYLRLRIDGAPTIESCKEYKRLGVYFVEQNQIISAHLKYKVNSSPNLMPGVKRYVSDEKAISSKIEQAQWHYESSLREIAEQVKATLAKNKEYLVLIQQVKEMERSVKQSITAEKKMPEVELKAQLKALKGRWDIKGVRL